MATGKLSNFKKETLSFFYTVFTLLFLISIFTHDPDDPSFFNSGLSDSVNNYIGIVGAYISFLFFYLFGKVSFLIPIIFIYIILKNYMMIQMSQKETPMDRLAQDYILCSYLWNGITLSLIHISEPTSPERIGV